MATPLQLTPEIATSLMQRSMTTGVPTFELQQYGGLEAVKSAYEKAGGGYDPTRFASAQPAAAAPITPNVGATPPPPPSGIAALPIAPPAYDAANVPTIASLYQQVLGRTPDPGGLQYWEKEIGSGGISPEEYQKFIDVAKPELDVQSLYRQYLGRGADPKGLEYWKNKIASEGISPEERTQFFQTAIPEMITSAYQNVLGRGIADTDPGRAYYTEQLRSGALKPEDFIPTLVRGATGADIFPAQQFSIIGSQNYVNDFERVRPNIEKNLGLQAGSLKTDIDAASLANKDLNEIQNILRESGVNRYQEAQTLANFAKGLYGLTDEQKKTLTSNLLQGKESNKAISDYYEGLIKGEVSPETIKNFFTDVAKKNPESQYFKDNPRAMTLTTPVGEIKRGEETSYTYGKDPVTGLPILHKEGFEKALGDEVLLYGAEDYTNSTKHQYVGADPHSRYQGMLARGTGAYGVSANKQEINDFARIEKEIQKLGGIQVAGGGDSGTVEYVEIPSESGEPRRVRVEDLFDTGGEFAYNGADRYKLYRDTKEKLNSIAQGIYKDPNLTPEYKDIKDAYDDLNDKTKNVYVWQGRTDTLDPETLKTLGIEDPTDNAQHIRVYYEAQGDRLFPILQDKVVNGQQVKVPYATPFKFSDPNTTSGFLGDIANFAIELASLPPIAMALSAATGGISNLLNPVIAPITQSLMDMGLGELAARSISNSIANMAISSLTGGDVGKTGISSLASNLIGGVQTKGPIADYKIPGYNFIPGYGEQLLDYLGYLDTDISSLIPATDIAKTAGLYTGAKLADMDANKVLVNQAIASGFKRLPGTSSIFDTQGGGGQLSFNPLESENEKTVFESNYPRFVLSDEEKAKIDQEIINAKSGDTVVPGITGLKMGQENWLIDATREIVPILMTKGLSKSEASMLAGNLIRAAMPSGYPQVREYGYGV